MGCSLSKETNPPIAPEPLPDTVSNINDSKRPEPAGSNAKDGRRPEALLSAATSTKTAFHTHTTDASSFYGFKGGGRSMNSLGSTAEASHHARSEGSSEVGSLLSSSSKKSGGFSGNKLCEQSDEEGFEEDFEDDDERPSPRTRRTSGAGTASSSKQLGLAPMKSNKSPSLRIRAATSPPPAPAAVVRPPVVRCVPHQCFWLLTCVASERRICLIDA